MKSLDDTLAQYEMMAKGSSELMEQLRQSSIIEGVRTLSDAMTHMVLVIRWNQMELALLRTLEEMVRESEGGDDYEDTAKILLRLDDLRIQLTKQQQGELDKIDPPNE